MSIHENEKKTLANHFLFESLDEEQIEKLFKCGIEKNYLDGKTIFYKDDFATSLMIVLQGEVKICSFSLEGKEVVLNMIKRGELFGEIAFIDGQQRTANAIANGTCKILVIERTNVDWLLQNLSETAMTMMTVMCERLRKTSEFTENLALFTIPVRLARLLLEHSEVVGKHTDKGTKIVLRLSQTEIGSRVGATRESVNKHLSKWKAQGWIELDIDYGYITILNIEEIENIAGA